MAGMASPADLLAQVRFDAAGLVPAIAQQWDTKEVLMMAWMNEQTLRATLDSGRATYWSRSRRSEWRKGDTSGHIQYVRSISYDCDGDTLLLEVDQIGPACHTGKRSCFEAGTVTIRVGIGESAPSGLNEQSAANEQNSER